MKRDCFSRGSEGQCQTDVFPSASGGSETRYHTQHAAATAEGGQDAKNYFLRWASVM